MPNEQRIRWTYGRKLGVLAIVLSVIGIVMGLVGICCRNAARLSLDGQSVPINTNEK